MWRVTAERKIPIGRIRRDVLLIPVESPQDALEIAGNHIDTDLKIVKMEIVKTEDIIYNDCTMRLILLEPKFGKDPAAVLTARAQTKYRPVDDDWEEINDGILRA